MLFVRDYLDDRVVHRNDDAPDDPLVSVILPSHARLRCGMLERAIRSVLSQTSRDLELIVVDDGSRDGTREFVSRCRAADSRVVHVRHERNSGLPGLRVNEGIALARGRYVAFQFEDDTWRPDFLAVLTAAAAGLGYEAVIVGTSIIHRDGDSQQAPFVEVNHSTLFENNRFGNNCALVPRGLFDRCGMYDCHIGMGRACAWDLWLRLIRSVPFHVVAEVVADIYTFQEGGVGETTPRDVGLFRYLHDIPRDHLLTPGCWVDYEVDALRIGGVPLRGDLGRRVYEEHILPYYLRFRHQFPRLGGLGGTPPWPAEGLARDAILVVDDDFDDSYYSNIVSCDRLSSRRGGYKVHRAHSAQAGSGAVGADAVMLGRLRRSRDEGFARAALEAGRPVAYFLDTDPFAPPRPGASAAPADQADVGAPARLIAGADAVWVADPALAPTAHAYNRRTVPLAGSIPPEWLPDRPPSRDPARPVTIGYAGNVPLGEMGFLREALARVAAEFGDRVRLEPEWADAPAPGSAGYSERLGRLRAAGPDVLLMPLPDGPRPGGRPMATPYHEAAVAGALGIFSDVPGYAALPGEETCLKAANTAVGWAEALRRAVTMPAAEFDRMRAACLAHVREVGTAAARVDAYEAAWRATEFHRLTRHRRGHAGRPRVAYFFHSQYTAGAEIQLWRRLRLMPSYGVEPIAVLPRAVQDSEATHATREELARLGIELVFADFTYHAEPGSPPECEREGLRDLLGELRPALVHSTTYMSGVGRACRELGIPHVASLYQIDDDIAPDPGSRPWARAHCDLVLSDSLRYTRRWGEVLGAESLCARNLVPDPLFDLGRRRSAAVADDRGGSPAATRVVLLGAVQPRKGQFAAVVAAGELRREGLPVALEIHGYTQFYPDFLRACERRIAEDEAQEAIRFMGFNPDPMSALRWADILLCSSTFESFPTSISEAMAAGVLVVSTPAGGISELIVDGVSGIVCRGFTELDILEGLRRAVRLSAEERRRIVGQARRVALEEFHVDRAANVLFGAYVRAIHNREAFHESVPPATALDPAAGAGSEPCAATGPASPAGAPRRRILSSMRRLARRVDTRLMRLLRIPPPGEAQPGPAGVTPHSPHAPGGPHRLGRVYYRLRSLARRVDTSFARSPRAPSRDATS